MNHSYETKKLNLSHNEANTTIYHQPYVKFVDPKNIAVGKQLSFQSHSLDYSSFPV